MIAAVKKRADHTGGGFSVFRHSCEVEVGRKRIVKPTANRSLSLNPLFQLPTHPRVTLHTLFRPASRAASYFLPTHRPPAIPNTRLCIHENELARTEAVDDRTQVEEVVGAQSTA